MGPRVDGAQRETRTVGGGAARRLRNSRRCRDSGWTVAAAVRKHRGGGSGLLAGTGMARRRGTGETMQETIRNHPIYSETK